MEITVATSDELDVLVDQWIALARDQRQYGSHLAPEANRETIRRHLAAHVATNTLLVARENGIHGFVMFEIETGAFEQTATRGLIHNIYVVPGSRNQGIGSQLLDAAESSLETAGADVVAIEALTANDAAARLYERHGYQPHRTEFERPLENDTHSNHHG